MCIRFPFRFEMEQNAFFSFPKYTTINNEHSSTQKQLKTVAADANSAHCVHSAPRGDLNWNGLLHII